MNIATQILLFLGVFFNLCAALGILRMPDIFCRLQVATKAATLGSICLSLGAGIHFASQGYFLNAIAISVFLLITTPVAAHVIALTKHRG